MEATSILQHKPTKGLRNTRFKFASFLNYEERTNCSRTTGEAGDIYCEKKLLTREEFELVTSRMQVGEIKHYYTRAMPVVAHNRFYFGRRLNI